MEITNEQRNFVIDNHRELRLIIPTERQARIIDFIESESESCVGSHSVAEKFNISIPNASNALKRLWCAGHINRVFVGDPTGGNLYNYKALEHRQKGIMYE